MQWKDMEDVMKWFADVVRNFVIFVDLVGVLNILKIHKTIVQTINKLCKSIRRGEI